MHCGAQLAPNPVVCSTPRRSAIRFIVCTLAQPHGHLTGRCGPGHCLSRLCDLHIVATCPRHVSGCRMHLHYTCADHDTDTNTLLCAAIDTVVNRNVTHTRACRVIESNLITCLINIFTIHSLTQTYLNLDGSTPYHVESEHQQPVSDHCDKPVVLVETFFMLVTI
jgi:hypothetical protein